MPTNRPAPSRHCVKAGACPLPRRSLADAARAANCQNDAVSSRLSKFSVLAAIPWFLQLSLVVGFLIELIRMDAGRIGRSTSTGAACGAGAANCLVRKGGTVLDYCKTQPASTGC